MTDFFDIADEGENVEREAYDREVETLRADLLDVQYSLKENGKFPVIVLVNGVDGAGKGETVNILNEWMDARHIHTKAFAPPTEEELERPRLYRYWMNLPPKGSIGLLFGSWYTDPIVDRVYRRTKRSDLDDAVDEITRLERLLVADGALLIKLWFHLSKKDQKKRLTELDEDERRTWRVTRADWKQFRRYDDFRRVSSYVLSRTSLDGATWTVVNGRDARHRYLTVGRLLLSAMKQRLERAQAEPARSAPAQLVRTTAAESPIDSLDFSKTISEEDYNDELERLRGRLNRLTRHKHFSKISVVAAFEGMDAAGKGSTIRRIISAVDARLYRVIPISAPTEEERAKPYLYRFYRQLPRHGHMTLYDRSWYGRVLVERVEGYCSEQDFMRAYDEINDFEAQLVKSRAVVVKFWLQVSKDEQLRRFEERSHTRFKRFKITPEDYRNREKWDAYQIAAADMIVRTSTSHAPWTLVPANDKKYSRIHAMRTLVERMEEALDAL
ncbi:MAG TPA: polyphosphate:AMP phosphotransferase [Polyangiaceae bacterium]|nr:polyphosphate:AMP phosphotransferase [Polyangiaceae bacterium]